MNDNDDTFRNRFFYQNKLLYSSFHTSNIIIHCQIDLCNRTISNLRGVSGCECIRLLNLLFCRLCRRCDVYFAGILQCTLLQRPDHVLFFSFLRSLTHVLILLHDSHTSCASILFQYKYPKLSLTQLYIFPNSITDHLVSR